MNDQAACRQSYWRRFLPRNRDGNGRAFKALQGAFPVFSSIFRSGENAQAFGGKPGQQ
jgi:hypothetical protein